MNLTNVLMHLMWRQCHMKKNHQREQSDNDEEKYRTPLVDIGTRSRARNTISTQR
jgi:hypothetical protein